MSEYLIKNKSSALSLLKYSKLEMNGLEFKKYRKELSISQEMMGKSLFVSKRTIINYEKSKKVPKDKVQLMLSIYSGSEALKEEEIKNQKLMLKIKQLRRNNNESQTALSKVIGVSMRTIQNWESGKVDVPSKKLELIAQYYGVTVAYLFKEEEEEEDLKLMFIIKLYKEQKKTNELLSKLLKK